MKKLLVATALLLLAGCGADGLNPPELTGISLSRVEVRRFREFFATAKLTDPDADLNGVKLEIVLESVDGDTKVDTTVGVFDQDPMALSGDVTVGLTLSGDADLGAYELRMTAEDRTGLESTPAVARLTVEQ